ncbi:MAG: tRNA pseudouridine(55) synthase [Kiritimatiellae bacterium]|jgi:tRNA pseudouridine55 synthase|nr:tRNA pseudouridine(55) synthase [Kiritimatiellia bacterium]MBR2941327.1 tRNA pseudouridine(55) synthase [Kiritimatiellia bacterium]
MANLTQLKMLEGLDGVLLVDKPVGIAFSTVVKTVKRKFNLVKVGHGGSLDAQASGLFILLLGDANKFVGDVMGADREYTGTLKRGETTDTGDAWGRPVPLPPRLATLDDLKGDVFQVEPKFCAIRKEGTAEYEVVDTGEHKQFLAHVYRFDVKDDGAFELKASKGVIVRALAQDMGATLTSLRRTKIGRFGVADAVPFDKLLETEMRDFASCVIPLSKALL